MLFSNTLIPTLKENPAEAEAVSHKLLLRAGMIRKLASGIYNYLPLGLRVLRKVECIVREEMNRAGAQEVLLPAVQPAELWQESGRWDVYGKELLRFMDRHERDYCFGPTHEEIITDLVRKEVHSYRQLPLNLYQIQVKFRDEIRPRFGLIRGREFIMKDAYSFDVDEAGAEACYQRMYDAYNNIFSRCGLNFKVVEADSGPIGGSFSHEFMVLADTGEDVVASCTVCDYAANLEKAEVALPPDEAAPPVSEAPELVPTPKVRTVEEVAAFLKVTPADIVKTLIYETEKGAVAVLIRGDHEVNEVKVKNLLGVTDLILAGIIKVQELTGAEVGFAGPVDLKLPIYADQAVARMGAMVTGANRDNYHFKNVHPGRDFKITEVADLRSITAADQCPRCRGALTLLRGIEVGHIFKLGLKYSQALKAAVLDQEGKEQYIYMGCYGIGVSRIVAAAIEQGHDDQGIIFPMALAPFQVDLIPIDFSKNNDVKYCALNLHNSLEAAGIEVLLDDRDERPGVKFKDCDLLGIPLRVVIGPKTLGQGQAEVKERASSETKLISLEELPAYLGKLIQRAVRGNCTSG
jgi:prolyl-tRNA synthetase